MAEKTVVTNMNGVDPEAFRPGWRLYAAFASLAVVNLATSLDNASISTALPVSIPTYLFVASKHYANCKVGHNERPQWHGGGSVLGRHFLPPRLHSLPAQFR